MRFSLLEPALLRESGERVCVKKKVNGQPKRPLDHLRPNRVAAGVAKRVHRYAPHDISKNVMMCTYAAVGDRRSCSVSLYGTASDTTAVHHM